MKQLQPHPFTAVYPMMPSHEIDELAADIKKHGQRVPIVLYGGKILDGRNRYEACKRLKIDPKTVQFGGKSPQEYVTSTNLLRRHLSTTDRAKVAALMSIESPKGAPTVNAPNGAITQEKAAKALGVSRRSVTRAKAKLEGRKPSEQKSETNDSEPVDSMGVVVPAGARPYWRRQSETKEIQARIAAAKKAVKALNADDPMYAEVNLNGVLSDLGNAMNRFASAIPAHVCPYCKGVKPDNCKACKSRGVVSEYFWKTAVPTEMKPGNPF
jgi:hypothetical protein